MYMSRNKQSQATGGGASACQKTDAAGRVTGLLLVLCQRQHEWEDPRRRDLYGLLSRWPEYGGFPKAVHYSKQPPVTSPAAPPLHSTPSTVMPSECTKIYNINQPNYLSTYLFFYITMEKYNKSSLSTTCTFGEDSSKRRNQIRCKRCPDTLLLED